ncbi:MAG: hypothetical protein J6K58_04820 [Lachnospiraceae bacterium]|nr:hypothetical protein [Lachnospiraceae bacterium]
MEFSDVTQMLMQATPGEYITYIAIVCFAGITVGIMVSLVIKGVNEALGMIRKIIRS